MLHLVLRRGMQIFTDKRLEDGYEEVNTPLCYVLLLCRVLVSFLYMSDFNRSILTTDLQKGLRLQRVYKVYQRAPQTVKSSCSTPKCLPRAYQDGGST